MIAFLIAYCFSGSLCDTVVTTVDGQQFDTRELDGDRGMSMVADWSLPIFEIAEKHRDTVLSRLTYTVFKQADLFRIFKLSPIKFFNFFHALERGYWDIPYHNRVHAADVLHGCYYLTCHPVRPLIGPTTSPDSLLPPPLTPAAPISSSMSTLEVGGHSSVSGQSQAQYGFKLMALYTAAAMHDYDHPGRTNAFLVAAEDKKVLRSQSLAQHSYLVLEYILATDLKQHFEIIMMFNEKSSEMELLNESDRLLMAKMIIKMADINSPTKPYGLHRQWTDRICQEFYEQGDEERKRGMPITPYMDRTDAQVAKLQDSFIAHVVSPLALAMNEAGLLPILPGLVEPEMMINLKHNHQKWLHEIDSANAESGESQRLTTLWISVQVHSE
ncbi:3'5'-cyclic nucleotide phosphodiesterase [Ancylostoma ceylanicum]|uniref:3'5'-cyclic nucleotide phosphodiesterase n=1 Tax=Ancylostoma ceylanicum TaxID=53326 RepID=A0A0D6LZS9_9BILA|nr:3'5'-cyclic nucleotide phosphodiesterase [Ancylostoma ceylanicum]